VARIDGAVPAVGIERVALLGLGLAASLVRATPQVVVADAAAFCTALRVSSLRIGHHAGVGLGAQLESEQTQELDPVTSA
jgi:hypothetical protein